ncbi:MAG: patatin-like phospholipase family protein [Candidatus Dormibacteraceae bacterium]
MAAPLLAACADTVSAKSQPYRILAFCGSGIRGIASADMLARLAQHVPHLVAKSDLLAGTSIGSGIVSLLVAGESPSDLYESLARGAPQFFQHPSSDPTKPAFDIDDDAATQQKLHPGNPPLRSLRKRVLFTSFDVGGVGKPWQPLLFNNFPNSTNPETGIVDAVTSSQAMPGELGSYQGHIDGAFVNHDPTISAIALAVDNGVRLEDITVLCFGTGFMANWIASDTGGWGAQQWLQGDGNPQNRLSPALINAGVVPIVNAAIDGPSTNFMPQLAKMLLGDRYAYLNPTLDRFISEDDTSVDDLSYLKGQAAQVDLSAALAVAKSYWS